MAVGETSLPARGDQGEAERGFTLVELMVVLVIIGLTSAAVLFAFPDPHGSLREEAERFAARVRVAQETAVIGARPTAVRLAPGGYTFEQRVRGRWAAAEEPTLKARDWGAGVVAHEAGGATRATFDPTGGADPLALSLARDGATVSVTVAADGAVRVGR